MLGMYLKDNLINIPFSVNFLDSTGRINLWKVRTDYSHRWTSDRQVKLAKQLLKLCSIETTFINSSIHDYMQIIGPPSASQTDRADPNILFLNRNVPVCLHKRTKPYSLTLVGGKVINSTCLNFMYIEYFVVVYNLKLID